MSAFLPHTPSSSIVVVASFGEWFVRITERGATRLRTFDDVSAAITFAEREKVRLGIGRIEITEG